ncbi:hypothetical protein [Cupriavidus sp. USMAA2-4]|uniref:hypothetical protein n=1 Tax=Cupriavidus sp. USMAA2-4 TaxID=876364 RepID=UPI0012F50B9E|nr:hypothetical protein [Cupriavidus sp. USMAA2-4]
MPVITVVGAMARTFSPWRLALEAQRATLAVQRRANALAAGYLKAVSEGVGREGHASAANFSALGKATEALTRSAQDVVTQEGQLGKRDAELQAQPDALRRAHGNVSAGTFYTARIAVAAPRGGTLRLS